jgi:hypothetical protein
VDAGGSPCSHTFQRRPLIAGVGVVLGLGMPPVLHVAAASVGRVAFAGHTGGSGCVAQHAACKLRSMVTVTVAKSEEARYD